MQQKRKNVGVFVIGTKLVWGGVHFAYSGNYINGGPSQWGALVLPKFSYGFDVDLLWM